jgi:hypothetical protein
MVGLSIHLQDVDVLFPFYIYEKTPGQPAINPYDVEGIEIT